MHVHPHPDPLPLPLPPYTSFLEGMQRNALAKAHARFTNARTTIEGEICTKRESLLGSMVRSCSAVHVPSHPISLPSLPYHHLTVPT